MGKPAARLTDMHVCPMFDGPKPHVGGPITTPGAPTVIIGGLPAARVGDMATCAGPPDFIAPPGAPTVFIQGRPAARMGDMTVHGGRIILGCFTVLIGTSGAGGSGLGGGAGAGGLGGVSSSGVPCGCMKAAKKSGAPFVKMQR
jgi:uncharacterized Zn-binding protein involved in type VI secretion